MSLTSALMGSVKERQKKHKWSSASRTSTKREHLVDSDRIPVLEDRSPMYNKEKMPDRPRDSPISTMLHASTCLLSDMAYRLKNRNETLSQMDALEIFHLKHKLD